MKHEIPSPITDENFNQAWDYANRKLVEIQKKKFIRKILVWVANIPFCLCATMLTLNIVLHLPVDGIEIFFNVLAPLKSVAAFADPIIYHPSLHIVIQIVIYIAFLFVPAILCSSIAALIIWFVYQPAKPLKETEDKALDSKTLWDALFESQFREKKVSGISSFVGLGFYLLVVLMTPTYFITYAMFNPDALGGSMEAFAIISTIRMLFESFAALILLIIYGVYGGLNELLSTILKPLYRTKIDPNIQKDAKEYFYECNPVLKAEHDEEERILERAIEIKAKRRQEEADLIAKITYKNPIYKYIKIGIVTLILIIALVFASNKIKSLDIEKFLNELGVESVEGSTESTETEAGTEVNHE